MSSQGPQWWRAGDGVNKWALLSQGFENFNSTSMAGPLAADGSFIYTQPAMAHPPRKGDKVTAIVRQGYTVLVHNSSRCVVENITLYAASFMAVTEFDGKGSNRYSDLRVVRRNVTSASQLCATTRKAAGAPAITGLSRWPPLSGDGRIECRYLSFLGRPARPDFGALRVHSRYGRLPQRHSRAQLLVPRRASGPST